uniref:Tc1-like transposase DDE domain-containing protein n=1 Tax=Megaselia scalaris TaxID=36166 RepID=T1GXS1_MEGSC
MRNTNILTPDEITIVTNLLLKSPAREVAAKINRNILALHYYLKHRENYPPPKDKGYTALAPPLPTLPPTNFNYLKSIQQITTKGSASSTSSSSSSVAQKKIKTEPILTQLHKDERLTFAQMYKPWSEEDWRKVMFHDERKFNLDGPDGFTSYFHDMRNYEGRMSKRPRGGSVYIWFAITFSGLVRFEVSTTKLKPEQFSQFLREEKDKLVQRFQNHPFVIQLNNATYNCNTLEIQQTMNNSCSLQKWPEHSHDINICEHIWSWLIRYIYDSGRQFNRKDELISTIREAVSQVPFILYKICMDLCLTGWRKCEGLMEGIRIVDR